MAKDAQYEPHQIPLLHPAHALEDPNRVVDPAVLVVLPRLALHRALAHLVSMDGRPGPARRSTGKRETGTDEDGLDAELFKRAQVGLDERGEGERQAAGHGDEGLARRGRAQENLEVMGKVDAEAGVGQGREGT